MEAAIISCSFTPRILLKTSYGLVAEDYDKKCDFLSLTPNSINTTAGERIRTADVQLGKLTFYH